MAFVADKETLGKVKNLGLGEDMSSLPPFVFVSCTGAIFTSN